MESGVHSSVHENCHHQIPFSKFNLKLYYPPLYEREVWHYQKANSENIRKAISEFPWERRFANSDVDEKVYLFTKTIKNMVSNYIFLMKQLFVMIGIHLGLIKISKNLSITKTMHTNLIVRMKITPLLSKIFNSFNPN